MNKANAPKIIQEIFEIMPDAWLFGATLLGAVREGKIIEWDKDVDLGIDSDLVTDKLIEEFRRRGYGVSGIYKFSYAGMEEYIDLHGKYSSHRYGKFILSKAGVKVEICCFARGHDGRHYYASGTPRFFVLPDEAVYPLKRISYYDFEVNVAENAEKQLEIVYGKDWRTPREKWYFTADHYLRREHTIIELGKDDGTKWSKWAGRKKIVEEYGAQKFLKDINQPHEIK